MRCSHWGEKMYRGFSQLHLANNDSYRFQNITSQIELKFAGQRFSDYHQAKKRIEHRYRLLHSKKITYKQRLSDMPLDQEVLNEAEAAWRAVLAYQQPHAFTEQQLNLDTLATKDEDFNTLVAALANLKLARLLLAQNILQFYQPFTLPFFFAGDVQELLMLTVYPNDDKRSGVALRYESRTTSRNHSKEFVLGHVDFDHQLNIKKMWISLKPRGGWSSLVKVNFSPCAAERCPEPDFDY